MPAWSMFAWFLQVEGVIMVEWTRNEINRCPLMEPKEAKMKDTGRPMDA